MFEQYGATERAVYFQRPRKNELGNEKGGVIRFLVGIKLWNSCPCNYFAKDGIKYTVPFKITIVFDIQGTVNFPFRLDYFNFIIKHKNFEALFLKGLMGFSFSNFSHYVA